MRQLHLLFILLFALHISAQPEAIEELKGTQEGIEYGYITVPENHANPEGASLTIAYAIVKSKSASPGAPLIFFTGGPGESSVQNAKNFLNFPMLEDRDMILFDQRGIGYSSGLPNMGPEVFDILAEDLNLGEEYREMNRLVDHYRDSILQTGLKLENINSFQNARDVGVLMNELGFKKYTFFGGSYGTKLARITMDYFPERVEGVILAAPATWEKDFLTFRIENYKNALGLIFDHCEADESCSQKYPNIRTDYLTGIRALEENPILSKVSGQVFYINPQDAMYMLRYQLYTQGAKENAPKFISAIKNRDTAHINSSQQFLQFIFKAVNFSMNLSVERYEEYDENITEKSLNQYYNDPTFFPSQLAFFNAFYFAGADWHKGKATKDELVFKTSDIPTLMMVNKYDPVTPPENGYEFMKTMSKGVLLVQNEGGHSGGAQCPVMVMKSFLQDPKKTLDTSCLNLVEDK